MVSNFSTGFRAKLVDLWSLCNHVKGPKQIFIGNWGCRIQKS